MLQALHVHRLRHIVLNVFRNPSILWLWRHLIIVGVGSLLLCFGGCSSPEPLDLDEDLPTYMKFGRDARGSVVTTYKVGTPYQIGATWYYPEENYGYKEEGIASWYGPGFNGKLTANGEIYDMNGLTAAHKTLPMPSIVRVTNLENGRSLKVRINDRGPFVDGRIIDLSRRVADSLDVMNKGTARVRVEVVPEDSLTLKNLLLKGLPLPPGEPGVIAAPRGLVVAEELAPPALVEPAPRSAHSNSSAVSLRSTPPPDPGGRNAKWVRPTDSPVSNVIVDKVKRIYIQAGAFMDINNARRLESQLSIVDTVFLDRVSNSDQVFFRVRIGPMLNEATAQEMLGRILSLGYTGSRIVND